MGEPLALRVATPEAALTAGDTTLAEVLDRLLDAGIVIRGELWLSVADVDLVFIGADLVVASPDTIRRRGS